MDNCPRHSRQYPNKRCSPCALSGYHGPDGCDRERTRFCLTGPCPRCNKPEGCRQWAPARGHTDRFGKICITCKFYSAYGVDSCPECKD